MTAKTIEYIRITLKFLPIKYTPDYDINVSDILQARRVKTNINFLRISKAIFYTIIAQNNYKTETKQFNKLLKKQSKKQLFI